MRRNYLELREFLLKSFPDALDVTGENYPLPLYATVLEFIVPFIQVMVLASVFIGDTIWRFVPFVQRPPEFYHQMRDNPMLTLLFLYILAPAIIRGYTQTGAFEVTLDDAVVYSKLDTGRMPSGQEILDKFVGAGLQYAGSN